MGRVQGTDDKADLGQGQWEWRRGNDVRLVEEEARSKQGTYQEKLSDLGDGKGDDGEEASF